MSGLSDPIWKMVDDRFLALAHLERTGMMADFAKRPSLASLTCTGPDMEAAERAANDGLAKHRARIENLEAAELTLQRTIQWLSVSLGKTPDEVLELVMAS